MQQCHDWRDAPPAQRRQHLVVVVDRRAVDVSGLGLDPAPFDREAVRVVSVGLGEREIGVEPLPVPDGIAALQVGIAVLDALLVAPPVVVPVAALDLMRGGGGAPQEALREWDRRAALHALSPRLVWRSAIAAASGRHYILGVGSR